MFGSKYPDTLKEKKVFTYKSKGHASKLKRNSDKKTQTKTQGPDFEADTNFKGWYSDIISYIFDIIQISLHKFVRTMKELEQYLGATYIDSCQQDIMNKTLET